MRIRLTASVTAEAAATNDFMDAFQISNPGQDIEYQPLLPMLKTVIKKDTIDPSQIKHTEMVCRNKGIKCAAVTDIHLNCPISWNIYFHIQGKDERRDADESDLQ